MVCAAAALLEAALLPTVLDSSNGCVYMCVAGYTLSAASSRLRGCGEAAACVATVGIHVDLCGNSRAAVVQLALLLQQLAGPCCTRLHSDWYYVCCYSCVQLVARTQYCRANFSAASTMQQPQHLPKCKWPARRLIRATHDKSITYT
jgi:hypothetical protein